MLSFIRFFVIWVSENLSIPFWTVGHIHLSIKDYHLSEALLASVALHLIVGIGFFLSYKVYLADEKKEYKRNEHLKKLYEEN